MVDFYCDHQNTTLYPTAYMSTPASAASLPQDGDGTVTGTGATPAVSSASWDLTSASASSGTMTVMGASVTGLNGSGSGLASAIATAINASTASTTSPNGNCGNVYLKALVWATSSGATLTVYSRIASAALNYANNSACAMAVGTGWTSPPATAQFSGGVSGPFAYMFTVAALAAAVSATVGTTAGSYGAMPATVMGAIAAGDKIHARTKRSGSNVTITLPTSTFTVTTRSLGSYAAPLFFVADNGVKWSGDAGTLVMTMDGSLSASRTLTMPSTTGIKQIWMGKRLTDTSCNWRMEITGTPVTSTYQLQFGAYNNAPNNAIEIHGVEFSGSGGATISNQNSTHQYVKLYCPTYSGYPSDDPKGVFNDLVFKTQGTQSLFFSSSSSSRGGFLVTNCLMDHTGLTTPATDSMINMVNGWNGRFECRNVRWLGFPASANQSGFQRAGYASMFSLIDCSYTNIRLSGGTATGGVLGIAESAQSFFDILTSISVQSTLGNRYFVYETARKSVSWIESAAPRTSTSTLPDGTTNFSLRYAVTAEVGNVTKNRPVVFPRLAKHNSLADGTRTAKLRFLVDDNIAAQLSGGPRAPDNSEMWIVVSYVKTDGTLGVMSSWAGLLGTPVALTVGANTEWIGTTYGANGIVYDLDVTHYYTPYEISVSLPNVKTLTELSMVFCMGCQSASVTNILFVDPEWSLL